MAITLRARNDPMGVSLAIFRKETARFRTAAPTARKHPLHQRSTESIDERFHVRNFRVGRVSGEDKFWGFGLCSQRNRPLEAVRVDKDPPSAALCNHVTCAVIEARRSNQSSKK